MRISIFYDGDEDREQQEAIARGEKLDLVSEDLAAGLAARGHEVMRIAAAPTLEAFARQVAADTSDLIFNNCESFGGRTDQEQNVAAIYELARKRFTGTAAIGLALAGDKALTKTLLGFENILTPRFTVMHNGELQHIDDFGFPMFVKPANCDASIGIDQGAIVNNVKELLERISFIEQTFDAPALIEEFIDGREIYVGVLGGERPEALPVLEWDFSGLPGPEAKIADQSAKFDPNHPAFGCPLVPPAGVPADVLTRLQEAAVRAFRAVRLRDYGRVDFRLRQKTDTSGTEVDDWDMYVIEVNPNPHLARDSELTAGCKLRDMSYEDLLDYVVQRALERSV